MNNQIKVFHKLILQTLQSVKVDRYILDKLLHPLIFFGVAHPYGNERKMGPSLRPLVNVDETSWKNLQCVVIWGSFIVEIYPE